MVKLIRKHITVFIMFLCASCFAMDDFHQNQSYYSKAQYYFDLGSNCNTDTESAEKEAFAKCAIQELLKGVNAKEIESVYSMMEFYKNGLGLIVTSDPAKYNNMEETLKSLKAEQANKKLQFVSVDTCQKIFEDIARSFCQPEKLKEVQSIFNQKINMSTITIQK